MYAGNLVVPAAALISGSNYSKVAMMTKFMHLGFVGETNFYRYLKMVWSVDVSIVYIGC